MLSSNSLERNLQISGTILIFGLVVEAVCRLGRGPIAFLIFAGLGGLPFLVGIVYYLPALVRSGSAGA
jgi:hypothetical protein